MIEDICLIIPAAGNGSRLGSNIPKFLLSIGEDIFVADQILAGVPFKTKTKIIISPWGKMRLDTYLNYRYSENFKEKGLNFIVQDNPIGMGDAVFKASEDILESSLTFVVWGDQALINPTSVQKMYAQLIDMEKHGISAFSVLLTECNNPYVQYIYDDEKYELKNILETREGDITNSLGMSDCGVFGFTSRGLVNDWKMFQNQARRGKITGEINFLPFLKFL